MSSALFNAIRTLSRGQGAVISLAFAAAVIVAGWMSYHVHAQARHRTESISFPISLPPPWNLPGSPTQAAHMPAAGLSRQPSPDAARQINAAIPYVTDRGVSAPPFRFMGGADDRARARACLASAALYEAGGSDVIGQRAVIQVVLNRVRHPAYPPSICAVVYQGAERKTGCQFSFTCDGSMRYIFSSDRWQAAETQADRALDGAVYKPVGLATHYHTDWVHPYWSESLDKLTKVGTHLFFRWRGFWGTRPAFGNHYAGREERIAQLGFFDVHRATAQLATVDSPAGAVLDVANSDAHLAILPPRTPIDPASLGLAPEILAGSRIFFVHPQGGAYLLWVPPHLTLDQFKGVALAICKQDSFCRVQGWTDADQVPRGYPFGPAARAALSFEYLRDPRSNANYARSNCTISAQHDPQLCLSNVAGI